MRKNIFYLSCAVLFLALLYFAVKIVHLIPKKERYLASIALTIPEGFNNSEIADAAALKFARFNKDEFLVKAKDKQGYLFPDTYFFFATATAENVIKSMSENFNKKIIPLLPEITSSGKTEAQIIIMASLIEKEASGSTDRAVIAGILWKRLSIGMALQADAAPETYQSRGLPKNPIANPGIAAIEAAIHPQSSPYFYYLHGKNGVIHYAKTFSEHTANRLKYLK